MSDKRFAILTSSIFLIPLIPDLLWLGIWSYRKINNIPIASSIPMDAMETFMWVFPFFVFSAVSVNFILKLARKKDIRSSKLVYIFLVPILFVIGIGIQFFYNISGSIDGGGLATVMMVGILLFLFKIFIKYFISIKHRVSSILKTK